MELNDLCGQESIEHSPVSFGSQLSFGIFLVSNMYINDIYDIYDSECSSAVLVFIYPFLQWFGTGFG